MQGACGIEQKAIFDKLVELMKDADTKRTDYRGAADRAHAATAAPRREVGQLGVVLHRNDLAQLTSPWGSLPD